MLLLWVATGRELEIENEVINSWELRKQNLRKVAHRGFLLSPRTTAPSYRVYLILSFVPVASILDCVVLLFFRWRVFSPVQIRIFELIKDLPLFSLALMANKPKHMEPTDESDGFVNITPDPSRPVQVRDYHCLLFRWLY
jgi:hypothetical protein